MEQAQKLEYSEAMQETAIDQTKHNPTGLKLSGKQKTPQKWEADTDRESIIMVGGISHLHYGGDNHDSSKRLHSSY